jgi:hypothetical protein
MSDPRYPIGKFQSPGEVTRDIRRELIRQIEETPALLRKAVHGLTTTQCHQPYREGGWSVRQVVHHVADSHMNAYIRCKLAVTEDNPTIKTYDEKSWAQLSDANSDDVETSLTLLDALHHRWVYFLRSIPEAHFERQFMHPERGPMTLDTTIALYAWHGRHHVAHIAELRKRMSW